MGRSAFVTTAPVSSSLRAINYTPALDRLKHGSGGRGARPLRTLVSRFAPSFGNVFRRIDCDRGSGVELLSQVDMFAAEPDGRLIRRDSMPRPAEHEIHAGDILIAGAGQVGESTLFGRAIMADARLAGRFVDGHAVQLSFEDARGPLAAFVYAFLASSVGLELVRSTAYGTSVPGVRLDLLAQLPVPIPGDDTLSRIHELIGAALEARERFSVALAASRVPVSTLPEMQEAHEACAKRRRHAGIRTAPFRTLNAWAHVSTGGALPMLESVWKARLGDIVESDGIYNGMRFARVPCASPFGVELLSQRDVFLLRAVPQRVVHPGFADRWLFAPEHSLLIGGAGTLGEGEVFGRTVYVSPGMSRYAVTQHMLRVIPRGTYAPVAYAYLSSVVGRRLLRSTAVGTKILSMRPDLLRALPFPEVDETVAQLVAEKLNAAMTARDEAERAEAEAVRIVEEEVLLAWLS